MVTRHRFRPFRLLLGASVSLSLVAMAAPAAQAAPKVDGEFTVTGVGTNNQITRGPDGNIWVTLDSMTADLAKITPNGQVTEYDNGEINNGTGVGITAAANSLWVTKPNGIVKIDPQTPTQGTSTTIAAIADPRIIVRGPDGNLWTASGDKVVRIPPGNPADFATFDNTGVMAARAIAAAGDGTLWVADFGGQQVVNVTTAGVGTAYPAGGGVQGVWGGPGNQVAFTQQGTNPYYIGRLAPGGTPQKRLVPNMDPFGVTFGADNAYWVALFATDRLGRLTPQGAFSQLGGFTGDAGPRQITTGPNNTLWVTLDNSNKIGRITGVRAQPPRTTITKRPKAVVRKKAARKATVRFRFRSDTAGARFQCRLAKKGRSGAKWRGCSSPKTYKLGRGRYTFKVRARANGLTDASPAVDRFRVVQRKRR